MKILLAIRQFDFVTKLFAALGTGFDLKSAFDAGDENALKTHFADELKKQAKAEPTDEEVKQLVTAELRSQLKLSASIDPVAYVNTLADEMQATTAALSAAGIKADKAADLPAALAGFKSRAAGEELAKRGLRDFPEQKVETDPSKPDDSAGKAQLTGLARVRASLEASQKKA